MLTELDKDVVTEALFNGHLLLLFIKEYWLAKKSLKWLFFFISIGYKMIIYEQRRYS